MPDRYVIRWNRVVSLGAAEAEDAPWYEYVMDLRVHRTFRRVLTAVALDDAVRFSSWDEAAAAAVFIIHHIDEMYEDALEIIKVEP